MRRRFDWRTIHRALEERLSHLGSTVDDDPARAERLLRERSVAMARPRQDASSRVTLSPILMFRLGNERYALALDRAREVTELTRVAVLPGAGAAVLGLFDWREEFVVVFEALAVLGLPPTEDAKRRHIIVLRNEEPRMALAVDSVEEVAEIDESALQPPEQLRCRRPDLLKGATADGVLVVAEEALLARLDGELRAA